MDITDSAAQIRPAVTMAVQKLVMDSAKTDGASLVNMIASAPAGSVNLATQGRFLDARA